jgi:hypothetical protein
MYIRQLVAPRYALRNTTTPPFSCATSLIRAVNLLFFASSVKYGWKCWMQSRVVAFGVFLNHSITILSSSSPTGAAAPLCPLRFFAFGGAPCPWPFGDVGEGDPAANSSVAFLFFCDPFVPEATGLVARLFAIGLVARLAKGLFPRLAPLAFCLGALGLVARFATTECPPSPGERAGEVALESAFGPPVGRPTAG